jgi:hypothetical protein
MSEFCMKCYEGIFPHEDCKAKPSTPSAPQAAKPEQCGDCDWHECAGEIAGCGCTCHTPSGSTRVELVEAAREMLDKIEDWRQQLADAASDGNWGWVARIIPAMWEESEPLRRALAAQGGSK